MTRQIISAVFDTRAEAEAAVSQLRTAGVSDRDVSIIAQQGKDTTVSDGRGDTISDGHGSGAVKGLTIGAGVGALAGIAALAIPGIGPFIAAGALAETLGVAGASVATGALVGGGAGGLAGALGEYGVDEADARFYEDRITSGGVFVSVDTTSAGVDQAQIRDILDEAGGQNASRMREGGEMSRTSESIA